MSKVKVAGIEHIALQHIAVMLKGIAYSDLTTAEEQILHTALSALQWELIVTNDDINFKVIPE